MDSVAAAGLPGIGIPVWIQVFVLGGIALLLVGVPARVLWGMTRRSRERARRLRDLADRLRGHLQDVRLEGGFPGARRIRAAHEGRPLALALPSPSELLLRLEPGRAPAARLIVRTRGRWDWPWAVLWDPPGFLRRTRTGDPLVDETLAVYASPALGSWIRELALSGTDPRIQPSPLVESLVLLRRLPGVERMELRISPAGGFLLRLRLRSEDLLYRPEDLESAAHHAFRLFDLLAMA